MNGRYTIKINFPGGIVSPGNLYNIMVAATRAGVYYVSFGLRQQLLVDISAESVTVFTEELKKLGISYEADADTFPNIISSYPAEDVFIHNTWLSEGVYKDILDGIDYSPRLKINISDSNQSFTPMLTGNINWVASSGSPHFWHLFVRFPKTNIICEWSETVYTNDVARLSKEIEEIIFNNKNDFYNNRQANGDLLFKNIELEKFITKPADTAAVLPAFNLPYYEGLNRYNNNKYWLGVYRRDELFTVAFLKDLCLLCLDTKIGQLCSTPWKSIIVKGIEERYKTHWNQLLERHQINMRHAANELNFQVEDNCREGLELKNYLVKRLNHDDTRTFGVCFGIKTRKKSEVFSSIMVRRKPLISFLGIEFLFLYDILCAHDFNPNERTGFIFSKNNPKIFLGQQLQRSVLAFYQNRMDSRSKAVKQISVQKELGREELKEYVHQCWHCLSVYYDIAGDAEKGILPGTAFEKLPDNYTCSVCDAEKADFLKIEKKQLGLQPV